VANVKQTNRGNTRIFCFGIGHDVNTHLLDKIATETRAVSEYVLPEEDLEIKVSNFFAKISDPVLTRPSLRIDGAVRLNRMYPDPLPDLFHGGQLVLVGRFSGRGPVSAVIEGQVDGAAESFTYDLEFPARATEHEFIGRLWATRRVGYLLDQIRLHGENDELRDEVTDLARRYAIVTPYTAYLIVEDENRRDVPLFTQSLPQLQRDAIARERYGLEYQRSMAERYGVTPVARARSEQALRQATAPADAIRLGAQEAERGLAAQPASTAVPITRLPGRPAPAVRPASPVDLTGASRFVGGRTFFRNDDQWIDSGIQGAQQAERRRIQIGSPEYFELLSQRPETSPWLALGPRVQFLLGRTVFEIHD
jgi:Ca-activated chloride channel homolog